MWGGICPATYPYHLADVGQALDTGRCIAVSYRRGTKRGRWCASKCVARPCGTSCPCSIDCRVLCFCPGVGDKGTGTGRGREGRGA